MLQYTLKLTVMKTDGNTNPYVYKTKTAKSIYSTGISMSRT